MSSEIIFHPIGYFKSPQIEPYQAPRQPDENSQPGEIILNPKNNFEQALTDLDGCSHIWIIYHFHHNENWKPLVQTPRSDKKIGVFATRAPYRPNPIGMSVVKLLKIDGLHLHVGPNDILDGTPILDIKPYHPESDKIKDAEIKWLASAPKLKYKVSFSPYAADQLDFLELHDLREVRAFIQRQLEYDPLNTDKKRVTSQDNIHQLSYRTWRVSFVITDKNISILSLHSGYSKDDLSDVEDKYNDKSLHKQFTKRFT